MNAFSDIPTTPLDVLKDIKIYVRMISNDTSDIRFTIRDFQKQMKDGADLLHGDLHNILDILKTISGNGSNTSQPSSGTGVKSTTISDISTNIKNIVSAQIDTVSQLKIIQELIKSHKPQDSINNIKKEQKTQEQKSLNNDKIEGLSDIIAHVIEISNDIKDLLNSRKIAFGDVGRQQEYTKIHNGKINGSNTAKSALNVVLSASDILEKIINLISEIKDAVIIFSHSRKTSKFGAALNTIGNVSTAYNTASIAGDFISKQNQNLGNGGIGDRLKGMVQDVGVLNPIVDTIKGREREFKNTSKETPTDPLGISVKILREAMEQMKEMPDYKDIKDKIQAILSLKPVIDMIIAAQLKMRSSNLGGVGVGSTVGMQMLVMSINSLSNMVTALNALNANNIDIIKTTKTLTAALISINLLYSMMSIINIMSSVVRRFIKDSIYTIVALDSIKVIVTRIKGISDIKGMNPIKALFYLNFTTSVVWAMIPLMKTTIKTSTYAPLFLKAMLLMPSVIRAIETMTKMTSQIGAYKVASKRKTIAKLKTVKEIVAKSLEMLSFDIKTWFYMLRARLISGTVSKAIGNISSIIDSVVSMGENLKKVKFVSIMIGTVKMTLIMKSLKYLIDAMAKTLFSALEVMIFGKFIIKAIDHINAVADAVGSISDHVNFSLIKILLGIGKMMIVLRMFKNISNAFWNAAKSSLLIILSSRILVVIINRINRVIDKLNEMDQKMGGIMAQIKFIIKLHLFYKAINYLISGLFDVIDNIAKYTGSLSKILYLIKNVAIITGMLYALNLISDKTRELKDRIWIWSKRRTRKFKKRISNFGEVIVSVLQVIDSLPSQSLKDAWKRMRLLFMLTPMTAMMANLAVSVGLMVIPMAIVGKLGNTVIKNVDTFINVVIKTIEGLDKIQAALSRINNIAILVRKITMTIQLTIDSYIAIGKSILVLSPLATAVVPAIIPVILFISGVYALMYLIGKIDRVMSKMTNDIFVDMSRIALTLLVMIGIAVELIVLGLLASTVMEHAGPIVGLVLMILLIIGCLALMGLLAKILTPLLSAVLGVLATATLCVAAIVLIAFLMWTLTLIDLDADAVSESVQNVIGCVMDTFAAIFEGTNKTVLGVNTDNPLLTTLLSVVSLPVFLAQSLLGSAIVVSALISVLAITLIASMLRLLQIINLNPGAIRANVAIILDTAIQIYQNAFPKDTWNLTGYNGSEGFFGTIFKGVGNVIGGAVMTMINIVSAVASSVMLLLTVVSVVSVLAIAGMLRLLQVINLDPTRIMVNVGIVLQTARDISNSIFEGPVPNKRESSDDGGVIGFFKNGAIVLGNVVGSCFNLILNILGVVGSGVYLIISIISIASIMLIGVMLRSLGSFDRDKLLRGKETANLIVQYAREISDMALAPNDKKTTAQNIWSDGVVGNLLVLIMGERIRPLLDIIYTVGFLAISMVSLAIVRGLASQIANIGKIDGKLLTSGKNKAVQVVQAAQDIQKTVFDNKTQIKTTKSSGNWLDKILSWVGVPDGVGSALSNFGPLKTLFAGVGMISKMADSISNIAKINVNPAQASKKAQQIVQNTATMVESINKYTANIDEDTIDNVKDIINEMPSVYDKIIKIGDNLKDIQGLDDGAVKSSELIMNSVFNTIQKINGLNIDFSSIKRKSKSMADIINNISKLSDTYSNIHGLNADSEKNLHANIQSATNMLQSLDKFSVNEARVMKKIRLLNEINATLQSFGHVEKSDVKNSEALVKNYIKFIDRIDRARMESLKTTEKLMKHWADLSMSINGNFDKLAESINEHIMPALQKLDKTMDGVTKSQEAIIKLMSADNQSADTGDGAAGGDVSMTGDASMTGDTGAGAAGDGTENPDTSATGGSLVTGTKATKTSSNPTDEIVMQLAKIAQALNR